MTVLANPKSRRKPRWARLAVLAAAVPLCAAPLVPVRSWQAERSAHRLRAEAFAAIDRGDAPAALAALEPYVALRPSDHEARSIQCRMLDETQTSPRGRARVFFAYDELLRDDAMRHSDRRRLVEVALEIGRTPDALTHLAILAPKSEGDAWIHRCTGRARAALGEIPAAAEAFRKALDLDPRDIESAERLIPLLDRLERHEEADAVVERLVASNPGALRPLLLRGNRRAAARDWDAAAADIDQALGIGPDNREALLASGRFAFRRALARRVQGAEESARSSADQARERLARGAVQFPTTPEFPLLLADVADAFGTLDEAIRTLEAGRQHNASDVRLQVRLADRLLAAERVPEADQLIESLPSNDAVAPLRRYLAARRHMAEGRWKEAKSELDQAVKQAAGVPELAEHLSVHLAECCRRLGLAEQEAAAWRRLLRSRPGSEPARLGLAALFVRQQRWPEAIAEYRPLAHLPQVVPVLAQLLVERNSRLPESAREWEEIDALLARLDSMPHAAPDRDALRRLANASRSVASTNAGDASDDSREEAAVEIADAELAALRALVEAGRSDEAARQLQRLAAAGESNAGIGRTLAASLVALQLARDAGRLSDEPLDPAAPLTEAARDLLRDALSTRPDQLLIVAAWISAREELGERDATTWRSFASEAAADPSLVVPYCERLSGESLVWLDAAVRAAPPSPTLCCGAGDLHSLRADYSLAQQWYRAALDREADHSLALNNLAWLLAMQRQDLPEALTLIVRAIREAGPEPRLRDTHGCVLLALDRPRDALRELETSLRDDPGPVVALHLAAARLALGDRRGAADAVRVVIQERVPESRLHPLERARYQSLRSALAAELASER